MALESIFDEGKSAPPPRASANATVSAKAALPTLTNIWIERKLRRSTLSSRLYVDASDSVATVKQAFHAEMRPPRLRPEKQRLFLKGVELNNNRTLADYNVREEDSLEMISA